MFGRKGLGLATLAVVILAIGVAIAMWSETLRINVTVKTGEVDVKWSAYSTNDPEGTIDPGYDKDVAVCKVEVEEYDEEGDAIKLKVTIENAYPSYRCEVTGIVDNVGTIPVKLYSHELIGTEGLPLEISEEIPDDTQIDPGANATYKLVIHVLQEAEENATYSFEWKLVFAQWNEVSG